MSTLPPPSVPETGGRTDTLDLLHRIVKEVNAASDLNEVLQIIVAQVTTTVRKIPQEVRLGRREGLQRPSVANLDNLHVVDKARLGHLIGTLDPRRAREVKRALGFALDWSELKLLS